MDFQRANEMGVEKRSPKSDADSQLCLPLCPFYLRDLGLPLRRLAIEAAFPFGGFLSIRSNGFMISSEHEND